MTTTPKYIDSFKQLIDKRFELERHYISQQTKPKLSRKIFLEEIKEQYSKNKLVLVLGAGVSASCGVQFKAYRDQQGLVSNNAVYSYSVDKQHLVGHDTL